MLLNLTIDNWMSYRNEVSLNLVNSLERQHKETLAKIPRFRSKKVLPVAVIYGGNASGKTALFKALACLKQMVTIDPGTDSIPPINPFRLEQGLTLKPTILDITFLVAKTVYRYVVELTFYGVSYESLEIITQKGSKDVYERNMKKNKPYAVNLDFFTDSNHILYVAKSTRNNQLFLQSAVFQNVVELQEPFRWFNNVLELVGVESQAWSFATTVTKDKGFLVYAADVLSRLDTGIVKLVTETVGKDALPKSASLNKAVANLKNGELLTILGEHQPGDYSFDMMVVSKENNCPVVQRIRSVHIGSDGKEYSFVLSEESSGTQRLMGLLPMLFELVNPDGCAGEKVYVVDELDRCLHTMLTKRLISNFTSGCNAATRKQLLFTTHDLLLMDQTLMRRDEMYISQRGTDGVSELVGLAEFDGIRFDKDLIKSYLDGRFGGVPMLGEAGYCG